MSDQLKLSRQPTQEDLQAIRDVAFFTQSVLNLRSHLVDDQCTRRAYLRAAEKAQALIKRAHA